MSLKNLKKQAESNANVEVKNGMTKTSHIVKKGTPVEPAIKPDKPKQSSKRTVGFNIGTTLNMENYESLRADVWVNDEVQEGETLEQAIDRVQKVCESKLEEFVSQYREG